MMMSLLENRVARAIDVRRMPKVQSWTLILQITVLSYLGQKRIKTTTFRLYWQI